MAFRFKIRFKTYNKDIKSYKIGDYRRKMQEKSCRICKIRNNLLNSQRELFEKAHYEHTTEPLVGLCTVA